MTAKMRHTLRVSLKPRLYRDIEIDSGTSLYDLAGAIVQAFGFDFDHAFGFFSKLTGRIFDSPKRYELFVDQEGGGNGKSVKHTTVAQAFPKGGDKMLFVYDYGDEWRFQVEVVERGAQAAGTRYPKILAAVGKAPPQYPDIDDDQ